MINEILNHIKQRRRVYLSVFATLSIAVLSISIADNWISRIERMASIKKQELASFNKKADVYLEEKAFMSLVKKKLAAKADESVGAVIEDIAKTTGIKERIRSFKPIEEKMEKDYVERGLEVKIEGISLNQIVNILYKIEENKSLLLIKEFSMNSRFENPDLFDAVMHIVLITKGA